MDIWYYHVMDWYGQMEAFLWMIFCLIVRRSSSSENIRDAVEWRDSRCCLFPQLSKFLLATSFQPAAFHQASNEPSMDLLSHQDEDITSSLALGYTGLFCQAGRYGSDEHPEIFLVRRLFGRNEKIDPMGPWNVTCVDLIVCFTSQYLHIVINFVFLHSKSSLLVTMYLWPPRVSSQQHLQVHLRQRCFHHIQDLRLPEVFLRDSSFLPPNARKLSRIWCHDRQLEEYPAHRKYQHWNVLNLCCTADLVEFSYMLPATLVLSERKHRLGTKQTC